MSPDFDDLKLSQVPVPPPSECFVGRVMADIREHERRKIRWMYWFRIPAMGVGLATLLFFALIALQSETETGEFALVAGIESSAPTLDDVLEFALDGSDEPGGSL